MPAWMDSTLCCINTRMAGIAPLHTPARVLSHSGNNYPAHKLALKWAVVDKFHELLYFNKCVVHTDNILNYVLSTDKLDAMWHRWVGALAEYHFSIEYGQG